MKDSLEALIRPEIRQLSAYPVPKVDGIKLDAMENPFSWPGDLPEALIEQWQQGVAALALNRYPDPSAEQLRRQLRESIGLDALANAQDLDLLLGNGSDELIQLLAMAVQHPSDPAQPACILAPEPGFVMYRMIAQFVAAKYVGVPLQSSFELDLAAMLQAIEQHQPALIFLAYPNNPTANLWSLEAMQQVVEAAPGLVVVDEAYTAFAADSRVQWLQRYPNVLLMRTLSKQGLAGLRLGVLAGSKSWIGELNKLRLPYNINSLTQYSAEFALRNQGLLDKQADYLRAQREQLFISLSAMPELLAWPSEANFLLFKTPAEKAQVIHAGLKKQGVWIKCLDAAHPLLRDCLRVTVGTAQENQSFLLALRQELEALA